MSERDAADPILCLWYNCVTPFALVADPMSITLQLPAELESKLIAEASRQGVSLSDYLVRILCNGEQATPSLRCAF